MIPPKEYWPEGFTTDFVTVFPDAPVLWAPGRLPWQWLNFRRIDLRDPAWWHDLRYFTGRFIDRRIPWETLAKLRPVPNSERSDTQLRVIDQHLYIDFLEAELTKPTALLARRIVRRFGASHYWWATPEELERRGLR